MAEIEVLPDGTNVVVVGGVSDTNLVEIAAVIGPPGPTGPKGATGAAATDTAQRWTTTQTFHPTTNVNPLIVRQNSSATAQTLDLVLFQNSAGTATLSRIAADGTIFEGANRVYSAGNANLATTVVDNRGFGLAPVVGVSTVYARADHSHGNNPTPVTSAVAGTGISVSAATGAVTFANTGLLSLTASGNLASSGGQNPALTLSATPTFTTVGASILSAAVTSNLGTGAANSWTRVATVSIAGQYQDFQASVLFLQRGDSAATESFADVIFRVKQQAAFLSDPFIDITVVNAKGIAASNFAAVIVSNAGPTVVDLYIKIPIGYQQYDIYPRQSASSGTVIWRSNEAFVAALPAGTVVNAVPDNSKVLGLGDPLASSVLTLRPTAVGVVGQTTMAFAGQTANLAEWRNSANAIIAAIGPLGQVVDNGNRVFSASNPNLASAVTAATTYGLAAAVGTGTLYARDNHTHGTPPAQTIAVSGAGITATASGVNYTLANTGVTSIVAGTNVTISGATGAVTVNAPTPTNVMTLDTAQTITGAKTFDTGAAIVDLTVRAAVAQTADLQQWQDSASAVIARVSNVGHIFEGANRVYSLGNPPPYPVTSVAGRTGAIVLAAADVSGVMDLSTAQTAGGAKTFTGRSSFRSDPLTSVDYTTAQLEVYSSGTGKPARLTFHIGGVLAHQIGSDDTGIRTFSQDGLGFANFRAAALFDSGNRVFSASNANLATAVTAATTYGLAAAVGTGTLYARDNHTHGTPPAQTITGGTGITATASGVNYTLANTGVTSLVAGAGITVSAATGAVTVSSTTPANVVTTDTVQTITASKTLTASAAAAIPLTVRQASAQTGNLLEFRDAAGTAILARFGPDGTLYVGTQAYGSGGSIAANAVTTDTVQTITGAKTFTTNPVLISKGGNSTDVSAASTQLLFGYAGGNAYKHGIKTRHNSNQQLDNAIDFFVWSYSTAAGADVADPSARVLTLDAAQSVFHAPLRIHSGSTTVIPAVVQAAVSQTAALMEWRNGAGTPIGAFGPTGDFSFTGTLTGGTVPWARLTGMPATIVTTDTAQTITAAKTFTSNPIAQLVNASWIMSDGTNLGRIALAGSAGAYATGSVLGDVVIRGDATGNTQRVIITAGPSSTNAVFANGTTTIGGSTIHVANAATVVAGIFRAAATPTADILQIQNSAAAVIGGVTAAGQMTGQTFGSLIDGTVTAPAFRFGVVSDTGMYSPGTDNVALAAGGVQRLLANTTGVHFIANVATMTPVRVKAAASQTANLMEWQDSTGAVLARIANDGTMYKGATVVGGNASDTEIMTIMGGY